MNKPNTKLSTECWAGLTTFAAAAYIGPVNAEILSSTGMDSASVATATAIVAFLGTMLMGTYVRMPLMLAPAMGMNAYFVGSIVPLANGNYKIALGVSFLAGLLLLLTVMSPLRAMIIKAVPKSVQFALVGGLGLILIQVGLDKAGVPLREMLAGRRATLDLASISLTLLALGTTWVLFRRHNPLSILAGMGTATIVALCCKRTSLPEELITLPSLRDFGQLDLVGAFDIKFLGTIIAVVFISLFDSMATFHAVTAGREILPYQAVSATRLRQALTVDGIATTISPVIGTSPTAIFLESLSGVVVGGRTGLTAVLVALMFAAMVFFGTVPAVLPPAAAGSVLLFIGALMTLQLKQANPQTLAEGVAVGTLLVTVLVTLSLGYAIALSFILFAITNLVTRRYQELQPTMIGLSVVSVFVLLV